MKLIDKEKLAAELRNRAILFGGTQFNTAYNNMLEYLDILEAKEVVAEQEGTCNGILNTIIGKTWHIKIPLDKAGLKHGDKVEVFIIKR